MDLDNIKIPHKVLPHLLVIRLLLSTKHPHPHFFHIIIKGYLASKCCYRHSKLCPKMQLSSGWPVESYVVFRTIVRSIIPGQVAKGMKRVHLQNNNWLKPIWILKSVFTLYLKSLLQSQQCYNFCPSAEVKLIFINKCPQSSIKFGSTHLYAFLMKTICIRWSKYTSALWPMLS